MTTFTPLGPKIHVRLSKPPEMSAGGIALPQKMEHLATEAVVISTGPGHRIHETGALSACWFLDGDLILFNQSDFESIGDNEGILREEEIVATVDPVDNQITPEGDWVLVDPDPAPEESVGGILLADRAKRPPRSGVVLDMGPGLLRFRGDFAGVRNPVWRSLSLSGKDELLGKRAYWSGDAEVLHAAGRVLVRGRDLLCLEEDPQV